jgi:hypothetical protein
VAGGDGGHTASLGSSQQPPILLLTPRLPAAPAYWQSRCTISHLPMMKMMNPLMTADAPLQHGRGSHTGAQPTQRRSLLARSVRTQQVRTFPER